MNVLVSTPVFGLVWLWSIKSGIEVGWAIAGLGGNPATAQATSISSQPTSPSSGVNPVNTVTISQKLHTVHRGDPGSRLSSRYRYPSLSPFSGTGSFPATLGPRGPGIRERTWSSVGASSSNTRARGNTPLGPEWDRGRPFNLDSQEGRDVSVQLSLDGQGENPSDRKRSRVQSLDVSGIRGRAQNIPRNMEDLVPPSD